MEAAQIQNNCIWFLCLLINYRTILFLMVSTVVGIINLVLTWQFIFHCSFYHIYQQWHKPYSPGQHKYTVDLSFLSTSVLKQTVHFERTICAVLRHTVRCTSGRQQWLSDDVITFLLRLFPDGCFDHVLGFSLRTSHICHSSRIQRSFVFIVRVGRTNLMWYIL